MATASPPGSVAMFEGFLVRQSSKDTTISKLVDQRAKR